MKRRRRAIARFGRPESNLLRAGAVRSGSELWPAVARHSCTGSDLHRGEGPAAFALVHAAGMGGTGWPSRTRFLSRFRTTTSAVPRSRSASSRTTDRQMACRHSIRAPRNRAENSYCMERACGIDGGALGQRVTLGLLPCGITPHDPFVMPPLAGHVGSRLISSGGATDAIRFLGASQA